MYPPVALRVVGSGEHMLDAQAHAGSVYNGEVNWVPLSVVTMADTPNRATQLAMKEWSCSACGPFDAGTVGNLGTWLPLPCQHPSKLNVQSLKRGLVSLKITSRLGLAHSRPVKLEPSLVYQ